MYCTITESATITSDKGLFKRAGTIRAEFSWGPFHPLKKFIEALFVPGIRYHIIIIRYRPKAAIIIKDSACARTSTWMIANLTKTRGWYTQRTWPFSTFIGGWEPSLLSTNKKQRKEGINIFPSSQPRIF